MWLKLVGSEVATFDVSFAGDLRGPFAISALRNKSPLLVPLARFVEHRAGISELDDALLIKGDEDFAKRWTTNRAEDVGVLAPVLQSFT